MPLLRQDPIETPAGYSPTRLARKMSCDLSDSSWLLHLQAYSFVHRQTGTFLCGRWIWLHLTYQAAGDELRTRVVINFDREPDVSQPCCSTSRTGWSVDMPKTVFAFDKKSVESRGLDRLMCVMECSIRSVRRLIFSLKGPFAVEQY